MYTRHPSTCLSVDLLLIQKEYLFSFQISCLSIYLSASLYVSSFSTLHVWRCSLVLFLSLSLALLDLFCAFSPL